MGSGGEGEEAGRTSSQRQDSGCKQGCSICTLSPSGAKCPEMGPPAQTPGCGPAFTAWSQETHLLSGARGQMTGSPVIMNLWPPLRPPGSPVQTATGMSQRESGKEWEPGFQGEACCSCCCVPGLSLQLQGLERHLCTLQALWLGVGPASETLAGGQPINLPVCSCWKREPWVRHFGGFHEFTPLKKLSKRE